MDGTGIVIAIGNGLAMTIGGGLGVIGPHKKTTAGAAVSGGSEGRVCGGAVLIHSITDDSR